MTLFHILAGFLVLSAQVGVLAAEPKEAAFLVADLETVERNGDAFSGSRYDFRRVELDGVLYFAADHPQWGRELWRSDGTADGTGGATRLGPRIPGRRGSYPRSLTEVDGVLVFAADDGEHGVEVWASDGSVDGTRRLTDVAPGALSSQPRDVAAAGAWLFFSADDGTNGRELWAIARSSLSGKTTPSPSRPRGAE